MNQQQQLSLIMRPPVKYTGNSIASFSSHQIQMRATVRGRGCGTAFAVAKIIRDQNVFNGDTLAANNYEIPTQAVLTTMLRTAHIYHREIQARHGKLPKLIGETTLAKEEAAPEAADQAFKDKYYGAIQEIRNDPNATFDGMKDGNPEYTDAEKEIIEGIRLYINHNRVLLPEEIQVLIDWRALTDDQRRLQQEILRADVITVYGEKVRGIEAYQSGIDAMIAVMQALDGLHGAGSTIRGRILDHLHSWGRPGKNMDSVAEHLAQLEELLKLLRKYGEDMPTSEIKKNLLHPLLQADNQLPPQLLSLAANLVIQPDCTLDTIVRNLNAVSIRMETSAGPARSSTSVEALQATSVEPQHQQPSSKGQQAQREAKSAQVPEKKTQKELFELSKKAQLRIEGPKESTDSRRPSESRPNNSRQHNESERGRVERRPSPGRSEFPQHGERRFSPNDGQGYDNRPYGQGKSVRFSGNGPPRRGNFTRNDPPRGDYSSSYRSDFQQYQQAHGQYDPRVNGQRANEYSRGPFRPDYESEPVGYYPQADDRARYGSSQPIRGSRVQEDSMYRSNYPSPRESQQRFQPNLRQDSRFYSQQNYNQGHAEQPYGQRNFHRNSRGGQDDYRQYGPTDQRDQRRAYSVGMEHAEPTTDSRTLTLFAEDQAPSTLECERNFLESTRNFNHVVNMSMCFIVSDEQVDVVQEPEQLVISSSTIDTVFANLTVSSTTPIINDNFSIGLEDDNSTIVDNDLEFTNMCYTFSFQQLQLSIEDNHCASAINQVGEWIYYSIQRFLPQYSEKTGKITGMILALYPLADIFSHISDFSSLSEMCEQAMEALSVSTVSCPSQTLTAGADSEATTVCLPDVDTSSRIQVETVLPISNIPRSFPFQSITSFATTITIDMAHLTDFASIIHNQLDQNFMLLDPTAATVLQSHYATFSTKLLPIPRLHNVFQRINCLLHMASDLQYCESEQNIHAILRHLSLPYGFHTRPSYEFLRLVVDTKRNGYASTQYWVIYSNKAGPWTISSIDTRSQELRYAFEHPDPDTHPAYYRFTAIALASLAQVTERMKARIRNLQPNSHNFVNPIYDSDSDSGSSTDHSEQSTVICIDNNAPTDVANLEEVTDTFNIAVHREVECLDSQAVNYLVQCPRGPPQRRQPQIHTNHAARSGQASQGNGTAFSSRRILSGPTNDGFNLRTSDMSRSFFNGHNQPLFNTFLIRFLAADLQRPHHTSSFDHFTTDIFDGFDLLVHLISQSTGVHSRYLQITNSVLSWVERAIRTSRSLAEICAIYTHLQYNVDLRDEFNNRLGLDVMVSPPHGNNYLLGQLFVDRIGSSLPLPLPVTTEEPPSRYIQHRLNSICFYQRFVPGPAPPFSEPVTYCVTFSRPNHHPVNFNLSNDSTVLTVKQAIADFLRTEFYYPFAEARLQAHFLEDYSLQNDSLLSTMPTDTSILVCSFYSLTQPNLDAATRLYFGVYTLTRVFPPSYQSSARSSASVDNDNLDPHDIPPANADSSAPSRRSSPRPHRHYSGSYPGSVMSNAHFRREQPENPASHIVPIRREQSLNSANVPSDVDNEQNTFRPKFYSSVRFSPMIAIYRSQAFMLFTEQSSFSAISREESSKWYVADSGCQESMATIQDHLFNPLPCKVTIQTAKSGAIIQAKLRGSLKLPVIDHNGSPSNLTVQSSLYAPECDRPLLSIGALIEAGHHVLFTPKFSGIQTANNFIPFVWLRNLWWLPIEDSPPPYSVNSYNAVKASTTSLLHLWHLRTGHIGIHALRNLHFVVSDLQPLPSQFDFPCHDCMQSKMRQRNKPPSSESWPDRPFEIVHFDSLFVDKPTMSGCKIDSHFVDGYSRWQNTFIHNLKSEIPAIFDQYKAIINTYRREGSSDHFKIERIRTDNAGELTSNKMQQWFSDNQIVHELACPYTQSQNGISERHGGSKSQIFRGMLLTSCLPAYTWGYASHYATHIKNRCFSSILTDRFQRPMSPYMAVFGNKPSINNLHPFGCLCWIYLPKHRSVSWKLSARGIPCVFLGLGDWQGRKSFLALDLSTRRVHASVTAKFDETYFPCRPANYRRVKNLDLDLSSTHHEQSTDDDFSDLFRHPDCFNFEDLDEPVLPPEILPSVTERMMQYSSEDLEDEIEGIITTEPIIQDPVAHIAPQPAALPADQQRNHDPPPAAQIGPIFQFFDEDMGQPPQVSSSLTYNDEEIDEEVLYAFTLSYALAEPTDLDEPQNHAEALRSRHAPRWLEAEASEHSSLIKKEAYEVVDRPHKSIQILKARPVYKIKRDSKGDIIKFKVRVVAKGYLQKFGISYFDVFAPVSTVDGLRIIISIATQRNWGLRQFDVSTAYLNAPIEEEIYVEPPPGFEEPDGRIWLLKKSLYGAKQSAKNWGDLLAKTLREYGFKLASADHYIWTTEELFIGLHVDDLAVAYATESALDKFTVFIRTKFEMNDLGELSYFLGIQISRDRTLGITQLTQSGYIDQALIKFGLEHANIVTVPLNSGLKFTLADEPKCTIAEHELYRAIIGTANWKAVWTSPEISFAVHYLSRFLTNPAVTHLKAAKHLLCYLKGTRNLGPVYRRDPSVAPFPQLPNILYGFSDSDYAGDSDTHRSTSGYLFLLNGAAVSWKTKRQEVIALSSTEAEFVALSRAGQHAVSLRALLFELNAPQKDPTIIYEDNMSCITASTNVQMRGRMKHVNVRIYYIRDLTIRDIIQPVHCATSLQHADPFTKNLALALLIPHRNVMHGISLHDELFSLATDTVKAGVSSE